MLLRAVSHVYLLVDSISTLPWVRIFVFGVEALEIFYNWEGGGGGGVFL